MHSSRFTRSYTREIPLSILQAGFAVLVSASLATAQERAPAIDPQAATAAPAPTVVFANPSTEAPVGTPIHGESTFVTGLALDDSIPLPIPAVIRASDAGDVIEAPASGDPFFLGFAGGKRYPAAGESIDPLLMAQAQAYYGDGRPTQETYAFAMFQKRITPQRIAELEALGARVLSFHPHYCLKIALPPIAIDQIAAHPALRWLGVQTPLQKLHPRLAGHLQTGGGAASSVYINVFDSDLNPSSMSRPIGVVEEGGPNGIAAVPGGAQAQEWISNGWQQRALEQLGVTLLSWHEEIHAFRAQISASQLEALTAPTSRSSSDRMVRASCTTTVDAESAMDRTRFSYNGATNSVVVAGEVDSGMDYSHNGLDSYYWRGANLSGSVNGVTDLAGSHVGGTIKGDGAGNASYAGGARGLGWGANGRFCIVKLFNDTCGGGGASMSTILGYTHSAYTDSSSNVTTRPHVINNSWGSTLTGGWYGTEADPRTLDNDIYVYDQLQSSRRATTARARTR
jgi:hypothetical protein